MNIELDQPVPTFEVQTTGGPVSLETLKGKQVVLYFYPKDDTSGCTREANEFTARIDDFEAAGATVIGISRDSVQSHERFRDKHGLRVILLSDEEGSVSVAVEAAENRVDRQFIAHSFAVRRHERLGPHHPYPILKFVRGA